MRDGEVAEQDKEKDSDGDGVSQDPDRKQIAHSSGVTEESFVIGIFAKEGAGL